MTERGEASLQALAGSTAHTEACIPPGAQVGTTPGPLAYGTRFHNFHKATSVHIWMPNFSCQKGR